MSFVWHSQTVSTFHPSFRSRRWARSSRPRFKAILRAQKSTFEDGSRPRGQQCPCQKQPFTKITLFRAGKTISGVPGRSFRCSLNRKPRRCSTERTDSSGGVPDPNRPHIPAALLRRPIIGHIYLRLFGSFELKVTLAGAFAKASGSCIESPRFRSRKIGDCLVTDPSHRQVMSLG